MGENIVWDYSFIGDLDNGFGVTFSQAGLDDFLYHTFQDIENLPLKVGGTVQDSFPSGVGVLFVGDSGEREGYIHGQNEDGIVRIAEIRDNNFGTYDIDDRNTFLLYPFDLSYGESFEESRPSGYAGSDFIDSLIYIDTFAHVGNGMMKTYYGDVSNVVLYKRSTKEIFRSYSLTTGQVLSESIDYDISYFFVQNGNLVPLIFYRFSTFPDWTPHLGQTIDVFVYEPFSPIINKVQEEAEMAFNMTLSPNPASEKVVVSYDLKEVMPINMVLYAANGCQVVGKTSMAYSVGRQIDVLFLSKNLPSGIYFLRLTGGGQIGAKKLIVR